VANAIKMRNNADNLFIGRIKKFVIATAKVVIFLKIFEVGGLRFEV